MSTEMRILAVAVPLPLRQLYDFLAPENAQRLQVGMRVRVPFGARKLVGVVVQIKDHSDYPKNRLKQALEVLDSEPVFGSDLWPILQWLSRYYLAPIGEVLDAAMPSKLRLGVPQAPAWHKSWILTVKGRSSDLDELLRAPRQLAMIKQFRASDNLCADDFKNNPGAWRQAIKALIARQWLEEINQPPQLSPLNISEPVHNLNLNEEQVHAVKVLSELLQGQQFSCSLLHGVTGSGKTEVYFQVMEQALERAQQVLILVPEIGLTPQLIERVQQRFNCPLSILHSGLNDSERHLAWWHAKQGNARIIIGTRSAIFCTFKDLGLIVVDEEHDSSFKQQEGVRYQARDVAIYTAQQHGIPIVLGSATPSLESYLNAKQGKYTSIRLQNRATKAELPRIELLDTKVIPVNDGLSLPLIDAMATTLDTGKQVMLFLNRRGYAPVMYCAECGETAKCHRCDSHLTLHRHDRRMRCHHCGFERVASERCNSCSANAMIEVGEGTQRVEEALAMRFPDARVLRIDRDSTRRKGELAKLLNQAKQGDADILLGTQLLTKGHDFPNIALVGVLGADQGLYSTDFRASETLFQQLLQVSGRAGRRATKGKVYIQTAFTDHPFFAWIRQHDFDGFANSLLQERESVAYPPFSHFALLRAQATHPTKALQFLRAVKHDLTPAAAVQVMDAIPAPMQRRAGKYRAQLLISAAQRSSLNTCLAQWLEHIAADQSARKLAATVRWSLDIDPFDHY